MGSEVSSIGFSSQSAVREVEVSGKVDQTREYGGHYYTTFMLPAPDAYSMPPVVEVRSRRPLAVANGMATVRCVIGGSIRTFNDKQGVRQRQVSNHLDAVEL